MADYSLLIDHTKVAGPLEDFPIFVNPQHIESGMTLSEAQSIRIYNEGLNEIPREIVSEEEMWFKGDLSDTEDTMFIVSVDGTSSDYGMSDTYGGNNVWTVYDAVYHFGPSGLLIDSSGNGWTLNSEDGILVDSGKFTSSVASNGARNSRLFASDYIIPAGDNNALLSVSLWARWNGVSAAHSLAFNCFGYGEGYTIGNLSGSWMWNTRRATATTPRIPAVPDVWAYLVGTQDGVTTKDQFFYVNGSFVDQRPRGTNVPSTNQYQRGPATIGSQAKYDNRDGRYFRGEISEVRVIADGVLTPEWVATEYNNQMTPQFFYSVDGYVWDPIKLGSNKLYVGAQEVKAAYYGDQLVWEETP